MSNELEPSAGRRPNKTLEAQRKAGVSAYWENIYKSHQHFGDDVTARVANRTHGRRRLPQNIAQLLLDLLDMRGGEELLVLNEAVTRVKPLLSKQSWDTSGVTLADPLWELGIPADIEEANIKAVGATPESFAAAVKSGHERPRKVICNALQANLTSAQYAAQLQVLIDAGIHSARNVRSWRQLMDCLSASVIMGDEGRAVVVVPAEALATEWLQPARRELIGKNIIEKVVYLSHPRKAAVLVLSGGSEVTRFYNLCTRFAYSDPDLAIGIDLLREVEDAISASGAAKGEGSDQQALYIDPLFFLPTAADRKRESASMARLAWDMSSSDLLNVRGTRLDLSSTAPTNNESRYRKAPHLGDVASIFIGVKPEAVKLREGTSDLPSGEYAVGVHAKDLLYGEYEADSPAYIDKRSLSDSCLELMNGDILIPRTSQGVGAMPFKRPGGGDSYIAFSDLIVVRLNPKACPFGVDNAAGALAAFLNSGEGLCNVTNGSVSKRISAKALRELRIPFGPHSGLSSIDIGREFLKTIEIIRETRRNLDELEAKLQDTYNDAADRLSIFMSE